MFAWAVDALVGVLFVQSGTVARHLADVGERVEQSEFGPDQLRVVEGQAAAKSVVLREHRACAAGAHVVSEDRRAEFGQAREGFGARVGVLDSRLATELNPRRCLGRRTLTGLVEAQQCRTRIDLAVDRGEDLPHAPRGRCPQGGFHLHALQDHQGGAGLDLVAHRHRHGNNHRRSRGTDQAGLVLADAVADAVHLDEEPGGARDRDDVETLVAKAQSALVFTEPFDLDDKGAAVANHSVGVWTDLSDVEAIGLALVVELNLLADGVAGARSATTCRCQEGGAFAAFFGFVCVDRGRDERDVGRRRGACRRSSAGAVEPAGVRRRGDDLVTARADREGRTCWWCPRR